MTCFEKVQLRTARKHSKISHISTSTALQVLSSIYSHLRTILKHLQVLRMLQHDNYSLLVGFPSQIRLVKKSATKY